MTSRSFSPLRWNRLTFAFVLALVPVLGLTACEPPTKPLQVERFVSPETEALGLPFSDAVRVGDLLFLSGQIGNRPGTLEIVPGGVNAEARQALKNVETILEANGSSMDRVVKCTLMLTDMGDWRSVNAVYVQEFPGPKPARSAFGASGLALGASVEIECIATIAE